MLRWLSRVRPPPAPTRLLLLASCLLLLLPLPGARSIGLYSPNDPLVLLRADTLERSVFNSSSAWVVEFYASWCGHCIHFAPTWRALANDIKDWRPAVMLGVIDCADMANQKVCSDFGITGYPTLKFFKAFSKKPDDGIRLYHHGDDIRSLRESIITSLERHEVVWPPACPPLEPISAAELYGFFQMNNSTYLALIFEKDDSFLGREVTMDMLQFENVAVRRVLKSNVELVKSFNITSFPSGILLTSNGSSHLIPVHAQMRSLYTNYLRRLPGVSRGHSFIPTEPPSEGPKTTPAPWRVVDRKKLYMADVESAVLYTLRVEAARFLHLDKERLSTLKQYVALLVKYFPGRPVVMNYLRNLNWWLQPMTNVSQSEWEVALQNKKELPNARLPETPTWVGCQGSKPRFRGYPCALWTLFHLLTVQEALHNPKYAYTRFLDLELESLIDIPTRPSLASLGSTAVCTPAPHLCDLPPKLTVQSYSSFPGTPSEVLPTMRAYVRYFFGCRECADHFEGMAAESMNKVKNKNEAILWLWSRHNRVNARLAGTSSDDPKFPKIQWPPQDLCWSCQLTINGRRMWDERAILKFFKSHFSRANIYLDFLKLERENRIRNGRDVEDQNQHTEGKLEGEEGENGQGVEEEFEEKEKRTEKLKNVRVDKPGLERTSSQELHNPSIVKMSTETKEPEEDIVDLDTFSEQHYRSKALKAAGQGNSRLQRSRREIGMVLIEDEDLQALDYDAAWERPRHKGLGDQQLIGAMKEGEKEEGLSLRRSQWFHILGVGFSQLDVSLCIVLYFLSSMCLLGMYTFFRMRMRYRKGRPGYPLA